jgi:hypothetical protein
LKNKKRRYNNMLEAVNIPLNIPSPPPEPAPEPPAIKFTPIEYPIRVTPAAESRLIPLSSEYAETFGDAGLIAEGVEVGLAPATAAEAGALAGSLAVAGAVIVGVAAIAAAVVIVAAISADDDKRAKFTLQFVTVASKKFPNHNVVICHTNHTATPNENTPGTYVRHKHIEIGMTVGTCGYDAYFSPMGKPFQFVNQGDGGYINWAYYGQFARNGNTITAT